MNKIIIRPSGIKSFFDCSYRWYRETIKDPQIRVGVAAHLGTGIHKAAETFYSESIKEKRWAKVKDDFKLAGLDEFRKKMKEEEPSDIKDVKIEEVEKTLLSCSENYIGRAEKLMKGQLPLSVEKTYSVVVNSPIIKEVRGTLDIVGEGYVGDIKTMNKWKNSKEYVAQQMVYAWLRSKKGENVEDLRIHRVNVKTVGSDVRSILTELNNPFIKMEFLISKAEFLLTSMIRACEDFFKTGNENVFRGNPSSLICSPKYCNYWVGCPYRKD